MADQPRRVNFFHGLVLGADDLAAEQAYHREMRYRHNQLHGYGTVSGLEVADEGSGVLRVGPGWAVDALGREIVVAEPVAVPLEPHVGRRRAVHDLVIEWHEAADCAVPVPGPDDTVEPTRWVEQPVVSLVAPGEAPPDALVLARVTRRSRGRVDLDASVRRPLGAG
ncbi:hypothetical protein [Oryzobacter terrae]|uniref:hypothetical protein n=1 Tax=Oryzobacter terrae TaxID=1620385 RepID=UPI00366AD6C3